MGETILALSRRGLAVTLIEEHDSVPFCAFPGIVADGLGGYRLPSSPNGSR